MKIYSSLAAVALLVSVSSSGLAATATPEEATRLMRVFQTYLGQEPGVVTATPTGDSYDVKFDLAPLIAKFRQPNFSAEISPIVMKLADQGGGKWLVTQDSPISYSAKVPGQLDMTARIGTLKGSSVFDQNLSAFISSTFDLADLEVDETVTTPEAGSTHIAYNVRAMHYETAATPSGADAVDGTFHVAMSGITETIGVPMPASAGTPIDITIKVETGTQDGTIRGLKAQAIYKLIAWFVAHPSEAAIKENQAELKTLISAGLPLFGNLTATGALQNLTATTPMGMVGITKLGIDVGVNGIVADGMVHEGLRAEGLALPPGLVPPFAIDLVPQSFALDFKVTDFDLAAPAKMLIEVMDITKEKPTTPEEDAKLLTALLPKGAVEISMGPSNVTGKLYDLGFEGALTAGPVGVPVGIATIKAKGLDEVMKALQAAPPDVAGKAIPGLIVAKGMAKTEADGSLSWKIENTTSGSVLVNGIDVSKMGGGN